MTQAVDDVVVAISTELLGAAADEVASTIRLALERLGRAVDTDRAYVLKLDVPAVSPGTAFEEWWADGVEQRATPIPSLPVEAQRFWMRTLRTGQVLVAADVEELEATAPEAVAALRGDGVRSILFVPMIARGATVGFIGFEGRRRSVEWDAVTITRMRTVGELIVMAVERCQAEADRAAATEALAARNAELERSNRELQQFAAVVSHDLRQPLVVMQGFLDVVIGIAVEHPAKQEMAVRAGDAARRGVARMRALIDDVLAVAQAGAPIDVAEPVDLGEVVADVLADLDAAVVEAGAVVSVGSLPTIEGSATQLRRLVQNLVANSLKFPRPGEPPHVDVSARTVGGSCVLTVADEGIGIAPEHRDAVLEMFGRPAGTSAPGLGIGLAVCAKVVAAHHGTISVEESATGGCAVVVSLPLRRPEAPG